MEHIAEQGLFETIVGNLGSGIYVLQEGRAVYLNDHFGKFFGYDSVASLVGRDMFTEVYPDPSSVDLFRDIHEQMLRQNTAQTSWAMVSARRDGTPFWLEVEARLITVGGRPAIFGTFKDQTECQLIAEAMHVSQETLRLLLDAMEDRVYVVTDDFRIIYANRKMKESAQGDLEAEPCYKVCRGLDEVCEDCTKDEVFASDKAMYKEFFNDLTNSWFSVIELAIRMPGVDRPTKLAVARDITARREAERRIKGLSHRLMSAQEDERKRLSRELHDDLGQRLNAAKIGVDTLADDSRDYPPEMKERLGQLSGILQDCIQSVRQLSAGLRPPSLEKLGLVEAIRDHCKKLEATHGLKIMVQAAGMTGVKLDNASEIKLFRVVQEALHNVVKHAEASRVKVRFVASHPTVRLRIEDDGRGFDPEAGADGKGSGEHLGLIGMRERVEGLKGDLRIFSRPGQGTRIVVEVPCEGQISDPCREAAEG